MVEDRYYVIVMWVRDDELTWIMQDYVCTHRSKIAAEVIFTELSKDKPFDIKYTLQEIIKPS